MEEASSVESAARAMAAQARGRLPGVVVDEATLAQWIAARARGQSDALEALSKLALDDLALACAAASGDVRALELFDERCVKPAAAALARSGEKPDAIDEAKQALFERLFVQGKIAEYGARGALASWVKVALARARSNQRRTEKNHAGLDDHRAAAAAAVEIDPELAIVRRRYGDAFNTAFREAFDGLSAEERSLLRLHFVDGTTLDGIAAVLGVSRATAGRRMLQTRTRIFDETLRILRARLALGNAELESLLAVVRSGLEVSLGALVREPA